MRVLKFYGASDDLFEYEDSAGPGDEIGCWDCIPTYTVKDSAGNGFQVIAVYSSTSKKIKNGVWAIGVAPLDEGIPIPEWKMDMVLSKRGYSTMLVVYVPDDVTVTVN